MKSRGKAIRVSLFNHKGGVGKTTLTLNLASTLADMGERVLLVDADPQCNLTAYLFPEDFLDELLNKSDSDEGRTLWSAVRPVVEAEGDIRPIEPYELGISDKVLLAPGDIRLSEFESELNDYWGQCVQRKAKGFRGTAALSTLVSGMARKHAIDFVFYDCGPNIGPLNRAILLDCDYFVIPTSCDLFSLRALRTLGRTLRTWRRDWGTIVDLAPEGVPTLGGAPQFAGYVVQGFRMYRGIPTAPHSQYMGQIERRIRSEIAEDTGKGEDPRGGKARPPSKLGQVKQYGALAPLAQAQGLAFADLEGGSREQKQEAGAAFKEIAENLLKRIRGA